MNIIKGKDNNNKIIIINLDELKNYERLKDANVFRLLFGISDNSKFGSFDMEQTEGYVNLFKDFDISLNDWLLFISFIKNGFLPNYLDNKEKIVNIEKLNDICNKLGGINEFDKFYKDFYDNQLIEMKNLNLYNPQSPNEDIQNIYNWAIIDSANPMNYSNFAFSHKAEDGWSAHNTFLSGSYQYTWWRKLK